MKFYVEIEDEIHLAGVTKARESHNSALPDIPNPDYIEPVGAETINNPDYQPASGDEIIQNPDYVPAQEAVGEATIENPAYDSEDDESEESIENPDYIEAVEAEGEETIPNPDYVEESGEPTMENPDYVEGTPDLPQMIEDEGFDEDKDYLKWVIEKAAESYAKEFGLI